MSLEDQTPPVPEDAGVNDDDEVSTATRWKRSSRARFQSVTPTSTPRGPSFGPTRFRKSSRH
ncbi:hypothetical protein [Halorientalis marina]|uniref:hypothetical protein n=1 Tax=Halorientalis marina TaxID=2931976 RepID=UPI00356A7B19